MAILAAFWKLLKMVYCFLTRSRRVVRYRFSWTGWTLLATRTVPEQRSARVTGKKERRPSFSTIILTHSQTQSTACNGSLKWNIGTKNQITFETTHANMQFNSIQIAKERHRHRQRQQRIDIPTIASQKLNLKLQLKLQLKLKRKVREDLLFSDRSVQRRRTTEMIWNEK